MSRFLIMLDFIGEKPSLFINSKTRKQSAFGGFVFIFNCLAILTLSFYFGVKLFDRSSSSITYNVVPVTTNTSSLKVKLTGRPFIVGLTNTLFEILQDEGLYNIVAQVTEFYLNDKNQMTGKRTFYPMEKCQLNSHFGEYRSYFEKVEEIEKYFCLKNSSSPINIEGTYGTLSRAFAFQIQKCVANPLLNITCLPDVDKRLENINVKIKFLDNQIDHENPYSPNITYLRSDTVTASSSIYKRIFYYIKHVNYHTDMGYVFEDISLSQFFLFPDYKETIDLRTQGILPGNFINIFFIMDKEIAIFKKSFMKLQNLLAYVGGIVKLFTQVSSYLVILTHYNKNFEEICKLYTYIEPKMQFNETNSNLKSIFKNKSKEQFLHKKPLISKVNNILIIDPQTDYLWNLR
jgi:hypothetical protein